MWFGTEHTVWHPTREWTYVVMVSWRKSRSNCRSLLYLLQLLYLHYIPSRGIFTNKWTHKKYMLLLSHQVTRVLYIKGAGTGLKNVRNVHGKEWTVFLSGEDKLQQNNRSLYICILPVSLNAVHLSNGANYTPLLVCLRNRQLIITDLQTYSKRICYGGLFLN